MKACPLLPREREPHTCFACGGPLSGRQTKWCSTACTHRYGANHWWTGARWDAIRRSSGFTAEQLNAAGLSLYSSAFCDECGQQTSAPEVNHVEPRVGGGYGPGCHHHQTNLQVLCHPCHVAETTRQVRERAGIPPEGRPPRQQSSDEALPESIWAAA